jgi:uncharacterized membrane protein
VRRLLVVSLLACFATGCSWFAVKYPDLPAQNITGVPEKPGARPAPKTVAEVEKELAAAKEAQQKADQLVAAKEKELRDTKIAHQRRIIEIVALCSLLAGLICMGLAVALKNWRFLLGLVAFWAIAVLAYLLAVILPYLIYIGVGLVLFIAGVVAYCWKYDNKALKQVATAVETYKENMPGYKEHFRQFIDTDVDIWLNHVRGKLGMGKK